MIRKSTVGSEKDAEFIAAATELIEALERMMRRCGAQEDAMREAGIWTDEDESLAGEAFEQANAAIAKVEGKS